MAQNTISPQEQASLVREERARALQGLFNNCFNPVALKSAAFSQHEDEQPEIELPEIRQPEIRPSKIRLSENKPSNFRQPQIESPKNNQPEIRQAEIEPSGIKQPEVEQPEIRQTESQSPKIRRSKIEFFSNSSYCGKLIALTKEINFTALGLLAILVEEFPSGRGHLNIQRLSAACNIAKSALKKQLNILEQKGLIKLGATQRTGRDIEVIFVLDSQPSNEGSEQLSERKDVMPGNDKKMR